MTAGAIFTQQFGVADFRPAQAAFQPLLTGAGPGEALLSVDPAGQLATFEPVEDMRGVSAPAVSGGDRARYSCDLITDTGAVPQAYGALMLVAFAVPPERRQAVDDWYRGEHVELLMRAAGWLRVRRYEVTGMSGQGRRWTSLAFHQLSDMSAMDSEERRVARSTPWRAELEKEAWFQTAGRWVFLPQP
jgi:hypothetical protein